LYKFLEKKSLFAYDIETVGLNPYAKNAQIVSIAFSTSPTKHYFVHWDFMKKPKLFASA